LTRELLSSRPKSAPLSALGHLDAHETALVSLYGDETLDQATDMIDGDLRFFCLQSPGLNLEGCAMHQCLLKQYEKAHPVAVDA
jgi:ribosomal protein S12 methylthiotransferase accessory factor